MKIVYRRCLVIITVLGLLAGCAETETNDAPDGGDTVDSHDLDGSDADGETLEPVTWMSAEKSVEFVNPFVGSGGLGYTYGGGTPAAQLPVAPMRLGPDSANSSGSAAPFSHTSGYHYEDEYIFGFSHVRFVGTGVEDYGNFRALPLSDPPASLPPEELYVQQDKEQEAAEPGYYSATIPDEGVTAEVTVDTWAGVHRYSFSNDSPNYVYWDTSSEIGSGGIESSSTSWDGETLSGEVEFGGGYTSRGGSFPIYFEATIDPAPSSVTLWNEDGEQADADSVSGERSGALLTFDSAATVELRVGISFVDLDQASLHLGTLDGRTFEDIRAEALEVWEEKLSRVRIPEDADEEDATAFYSALYNIWRMPTLWEGVDGRYLGFDKQIHDGSGDDFQYYTDLSLWDTFRTLHPLYELIDPELQKDCLNSILTMQEQGGYIPRWPAAAGYTNGMLGASADHLFAGSAAKGIEGVDYAAAFEALYDEATIPQPEGNRGGRDGDMPEYVEYGYVPDDIGGSSVSVTLEYAYADASLANLAEHVGDTEKASELRERSNSWEALWYDDTKFILPRFADGSFDTEISTETSFDRSGSFAEGSAWHYRFYALHDLEDVVDKYGAELFEDTLETFFEESSLVTPTATGGLLPEPYYWHSNQPSIDAAFLFHAVDRPDRVAHWVTEVREKKYGPEADGVPGNDDGGTMSAWYVLSSIGLYPRVGTSRYWTSQPLFRAVQFDTGSDETTTLRVRDELSCCEGYGLALPEGEVVYELEHEALLGETLLFE